MSNVVAVSGEFAKGVRRDVKGLNGITGGVFSESEGNITGKALPG